MKGRLNKPCKTPGGHRTSTSARCLSLSAKGLYPSKTKSRRGLATGNRRSGYGTTEPRPQDPGGLLGDLNSPVLASVCFSIWPRPYCLPFPTRPPRPHASAPKLLKSSRARVFDQVVSMSLVDSCPPLLRWPQDSWPREPGFPSSSRAFGNRGWLCAGTFSAVLKGDPSGITYNEPSKPSERKPRNRVCFVWLPFQQIRKGSLSTKCGVMFSMGLASGEGFYHYSSIDQKNNGKQSKSN